MGLACSKLPKQPARDKVEVLISNVPKYLQNGVFYQTLIENGSETVDDFASSGEDSYQPISVPADCLKAEPSVNCTEDFEALLRAFQFWIVQEFPDGIDSLLSYSFSLSNERSFTEVCDNYERDLPQVGALRAIVEATESARLRVAAERGMLPIMKYLMATSETTYFDTNAVCAAAAAGGHLECLKFAREQGCPCDAHTSCAAAAHGALHCLKYLKESGCPLSSWSSLGVLTTACVGAASNKQLACLQYLHAQGCEWDANTCAEAALRGHLQCLQFLHEHNCPWDPYVYIFAVLNGQVGCLAYAYQQRCPGWGPNLCNLAALHGQLDCLKYLHEQGCPWGAATCEFAAQAGHLHCLQYAHQHGCAWSVATPYAAASNGHEQCLQYAKKQGCPGAV